MTKRKSKAGAGFAKRKSAESQAKQQADTRRATYGLVALVAAIVIGFVLWQVLRSQNTTASEGSGATSGAVLDGERPLAAIDPAERADYFSAFPETVIDNSKAYEAVLVTEKGDIRVALFDDVAPNTVNNFVFLASQGYYDGVTFHRVLEDFMAQTGDPTGTGGGGPGYQFEDEIDPSLTFDRAGLLAMANAGAGTNGSQFFITFVPTPWLNGNHTIFGEVLEGQDVLDQLTRRDPNQRPDFTGDVIERVEIIESD